MNGNDNQNVMFHSLWGNIASMEVKGYIHTSINAGVNIL